MFVHLIRSVFLFEWNTHENHKQFYLKGFKGLELPFLKKCEVNVSNKTITRNPLKKSNCSGRDVVGLRRAQGRLRAQNLAMERKRNC